MSGIDDLLELRSLLASGRASLIRKRAGLSASDLARDLGVTTAAVTRWEKGTRVPRGANARRYARMLHHLASREAVQ